MKKIAIFSVAALAAVALAGCQVVPPKGQSAQQGSTAQSASTSQTKQQPVVEFRLAQTAKAKGLSELKLKKGTLWYLPKPVLTRTDLAKVEPRKTNKGQAFVQLTFNQAGTAKLTNVVNRYAGKLLVLSVNGSLVSITQIAKNNPKGILNLPFSSDQQAVQAANAILGR